MSKKLHSKDLRRDEVAEAVTHVAEDAFHVAQEHRRPLVIAGIVVVVLVVGGTLTAWRVDAARKEAAASYAAALETWEAASGTDPAAEKPSWESVADSMKSVADEHGSSAPGKLARLHQGLALARAGKAADAAAVLATFVEAHPSHWAAPEALAALAAAREDAGDAAAAEAALTQLRDGRWRNWPAGASQMMLAQFYERQGRAADARAIYETLSKDETLKDTPWGSQAKARLEEMGAAPAAS